METNKLFEISGPVVIDWIYIVTVVLGSDVLMRISLMTKIRNHAVYIVLVFAFIVAVFFALIGEQPDNIGLAAKSSLVNYCIATSLYELIIKKIKGYLQNDNSKQQGVEPNTI